jgi:hypothetical protein
MFSIGNHHSLWGDQHGRRPEGDDVALIDLNDAERAAFGRVNGLNLSPPQD